MEAESLLFLPCVSATYSAAECRHIHWDTLTPAALLWQAWPLKGTIKKLKSFTSFSLFTCKNSEWASPVEVPAANRWSICLATQWTTKEGLDPGQKITPQKKHEGTPTEHISFLGQTGSVKQMVVMHNSKQHYEQKNNSLLYGPKVCTQALPTHPARVS